MKAIVYRTYGSPDVLHLEEVPKPEVRDGDVLVRVHAAAVNPLDWHLLRGQPYIVRPTSGWRKPKRNIPGVDVAGVVEAVGRDVTQLRPGDEVFGEKTRACAEYVCGPEKLFVHSPANLTLEQAAAIPVGAATALQALRDHGRVQPGQSVLINGASGGVGTFTVQLAKHLGAEVTGVCSTRNVELVRSLGADHVIDYTRQDFTSGPQRYDLIIDNHILIHMMDPNQVFAEFAAHLNPGGALFLQAELSDDVLFRKRKNLFAELRPFHFQQFDMPVLERMLRRYGYGMALGLITAVCLTLYRGFRRNGWL